MNERPSILVPYETFTVRVLFAPSDTLTPLEQLVIRAIHAGARSVQELDALFGIGTRPMLRLVLDLMNQAFVTLNFATAEIRLTPQIIKAIEQDTLSKLGGLERMTERVTLMRDLVAGTISTLRRRPDARAGSRISPELDAATVADVAPADVLQAIRARMSNRTTSSGRPMHAIEVALELSRTEATDGTLRYLELSVRPEYDEASDHLRILIERPTDLTWEMRDRLEKKLTAMANIEAPGLVFKNLRRIASLESAPLQDATPEGRLIELQDLVERLPTAFAGTYNSWQQKLERVSREVDEMLGLQSSGVLRADVLVGDERHVAVVREMIASATEQVVMACPFVGYDAVWQYRDVVESAVAGGRRVFFLLGIGETLDLDIGVSSWLSRLKDRYPNHLFFSRNSARCHAKFVITDAADALLTSYNFLHRLPGATLEVGVRLTAQPRPGDEGDSEAARPVCSVAADLLRIAREIFPDYGDAQLMIDNIALFGGRDSRPPVLFTPPALWETGEQEGAEYSEHRTKLWIREWERHLDRLKRRAEALPTTYTRVRDADHRKLLFDALRSAKKRLLILSDQLSVRVLDRHFRHEMLQCVKRGTDVLLVYRRALPGARESLHALAKECGDKLRYVAGDGNERTDSHAKLLVCDDWAVVTSFNFLSFPGEYEGAEKHNVRTELGVLIRGADAVYDLCTTIRPAIPSLETIIGEATKRQIVPQVVDMSTVVQGRRGLDALFAELSRHAPESQTGLDAEAERRRIGAVLTRWFESAADADEAARELKELAAVSAPFLEQAIAAFLATHPAADVEMRRRWVTRLIAEMWWRGASADTVSLLLQTEETLEDPGIPPKPLALLAANYHTGRATSEDFDDTAVACCDDRPGAAAVAALAIPAVLYDENPPMEALGLVRDSIPLDGPLRKWAGEVLEFRTEHPQGLVGIDVGSLSARERLREEAESARQELANELEKALVLTFSFKLGQWAWASLIEAPTGLRRLSQAVQASDVAVAQAFLATYGSRKAGEVLDEAAKAVEKDIFRLNVEIEGRYRRQSLMHFEKIVRGTKKWVAAARAFGAGVSIPPDRIMMLARGMADHAQSLAAVAYELQKGRAYSYPLIAALQKRMTPLLNLATPVIHE